MRVKLGDIIDIYLKLCAKYGVSKVREMEVIIGNDEELNGAHYATMIEEIGNSNAILIS